MKVLSILIRNNASVCFMENGNIQYFMPQERLSRKKHDYYWTSAVQNFLHNFDKNNSPYDVINIKFDHTWDYKFAKDIENYCKRFFSYKKLNILNDNHHKFHALCALYSSPFDEALCFVLDEDGSMYKGEENIYSKIHKGNLREIESVYLKNSKGVNNIFKHYLTLDENKFSHQYTKKLKISSNFRLDQEKIITVIRKYVKKTGIKNVVLTGGFVENYLANYNYLKNLPDINFYIDPMSSDVGLSVGMCVYSHLQSEKELRINLPYICSKPNQEYNLDGIENQDCTYTDVIDLILDQKLVAIFQGNGECGTMGLGNRSILSDPRKGDTNTGTVMLEHAHEWFEMLTLKESPYMLFAMDVKENKILTGKWRIQTLSRNQNEHYYNLINEFYKRTGVPVLMNTPFNLSDEPLVHTLHHAIHTLRKSELDYLYLPEVQKLIKVDKISKFI